MSSSLTTTNKAAPTPAFELKLRGISGSEDHRLAIINNHTFDAGEDAEVRTTTGIVHIRCLSINEDSAEIQIGTEKRLLRMRKGL